MMGRGKIEIARIENKTTRQVTFSKRRGGLLKKAHELSVLCDAHIGLIVFSSSGKLTEFTSDSTSIEEIIRRYEDAKGIRRVEANPINNLDSGAIYNELGLMKERNQNLELSLRRYTGEIDLNSMQSDELAQLEHQLQRSVNKVRAWKMEMLQQQKDNLQRKNIMLEEENVQIFSLIKEKDQMTWEEQQQQEATTTVPGVAAAAAQHGHEGVLDQFPFSGEPQPSSVLELAIPHYHPFHLQQQPDNNPQDYFSLHFPSSSDCKFND